MESDILSQMRTVTLDDRDALLRLTMAYQMTKAINYRLWSLVQSGQSANELLKTRGTRLD